MEITYIVVNVPILVNIIQVMDYNVYHATILVKTVLVLKKINVLNVMQMKEIKINLNVLVKIIFMIMDLT